MPNSNPLTPPSGEPIPDPLFDIAVTRDPRDADHPHTFTFTPDGRGEFTRTLPPDGGDPNTDSYDGPYPAAGRVRTHLPGYEILGVLGRGGMGVVYKARQIKLDRVVALKLMLHADHAGPTARDRFTTEAQAVARMQHPNIVQVFEVGEIDGVPYFSLEYVAGGTLATRVAEHLLPPREAAALIAALAAAVQYAHDQGIIHRDLKPTNILLGNADFGTRNSESNTRSPNSAPAVDSAFRIPPSAFLPKIADFGLAKSIAEDSGLTRSGSVVGTPSYMPPEQAAGDTAAVGPPADIYSLGAVLYELLAGRPPFKGANVAETLALVRTAEPTPPGNLQTGVPRDLETICLKCLQKEPARRYATARDLADDVDRYLRGVPILARPVGVVERAWRWCRRNPGVATLLGTVAALLVCIAVGASAAAVRINQKRNEAAFHRKVAEDRLKVYQKAVDRFVNEAPAIIEGHPLGSTPSRDLLELGATLLREVQGTSVDDSGLAVRGEMSSLIRIGNLAKAEGRTEDAAKAFDDAFKMGEELLRTSSPDELGKNTGNLALVVGLRGTMRQIRAEMLAGFGDKEKAREAFAEAVALHDDSIARYRRVVAEPTMRDIHVAEAEMWLGGAYLSLAETQRAAGAAAADAAGKRAAWEAARVAAKEAEEHFAAGLGTGWKERNTDRSRLRQALASHERARAADKLNLLPEADAAFQKSFELFDRLVRDTPKNMLHRIHFATLAVERGDFLMLKAKDAKRAAVSISAATDQARRLGKPHELSRYAEAIGANLYRMGITAMESGDPIKARDYFLLSVANRKEMLQEAIRVSSETSLYTLHPRTRLMFSLARAGDHMAAAAIAGQLRKDYPKDPARLNYAAQGFALCALATDDTAEAEGYLNQAFEALERALDAGYADADEMANDPDYSALRGDARFPPLLARAKANAAKN